MYKRSAEVLSQGSDEDIGALGIALELGSLYEDLTQAVSNWLRNVGATAAVTTGTACGTGSGDPAAAAIMAPPMARGRATQQQQRQQQQAEADRRQQREAEAEYVRAVRPLQFTEVPILQGHYFRWVRREGDFGLRVTAGVRLHRPCLTASHKAVGGGQLTLCR